MVPLLGGIAVAGGGLTAPFVVAAGSTLVGLLLGLLWLSSSRGQTGNASDDEPSQ